MIGWFDSNRRFMAIVHDIHGQLLMGHRGSWLVELAASWTIVMILTGLYLWWPRGRGAAGVVWPRFSYGARIGWRDMHAVTGFWVSGLALVLLLTGLPWAGVWGNAFKAVRAEMGWTRGAQDWSVGGRAPDAGEHAGHDHAAMMAGNGAMPEMDHGAHAPSGVNLDIIVTRARDANLAFPVLVTPPGAPGRFGGKGREDWTVRSDSQNRPLRMTIYYDPATGRETGRAGFADSHPIDRVVGYGVAWHEGQLFGWVNQAIGLVTALMLTALSVTGFILWRRRKPDDALGAPPLPAVPARSAGAAVILFLLACLLPLLALSLAALFLTERLLLMRSARFRSWLGFT